MFRKPKITFQRPAGTLVESDATRVAPQQDYSKHLDPASPINHGLVSTLPDWMTRALRERAFKTVEPYGYDSGVDDFMEGKEREIVDSPDNIGSREDIWAMWNNLDQYYHQQPLTEEEMQIRRDAMMNAETKEEMQRAKNMFKGRQVLRQRQLPRINRYSLNNDPERRAFQDPSLDRFIRQKFAEEPKGGNVQRVPLYYDDGFEMPFEDMYLSEEELRGKTENARYKEDLDKIIATKKYKRAVRDSLNTAEDDLLYDWMDREIQIGDKLVDPDTVENLDSLKRQLKKNRKPLRTKEVRLNDPQGMTIRASDTPHGVTTFYNSYDPEVGANYISAEDVWDLKMLPNVGDESRWYSRQYYDYGEPDREGTRRRNWINEEEAEKRRKAYLDKQNEPIYQKLFHRYGEKEPVLQYKPKHI